MKNFLLFSLALIPAFFIALSLNGCSDSSSPTNSNPSGGGQNNYNSVSNFGDIVRFTFSTSKDAGGSYSWTNETLSQTGNGTYTISNDPNLTGIYVTNNGDYIIEAPNLSFLTTLDFGRPQNQFTIGISSNQNLNNLTVTGDYIWISFGGGSEGEWGGYRLNADGTCTWGFAPENPSQITNFNYFQGSGSCTWAVSSQDSSRILFTEGGLTYVGTIYPEKYMWISNGTGQGMSLGIKYPSAPLTLNQVAGTYRGFDYIDDNIGVGYYTIPSTSAPLTHYFTYNNPPFISQGTSSGSIYRHPGINNTFVVNDVLPGVYDFAIYFIVLGGESMMHFAVPNDTNSSYSSGTCLKIN